jgi:hypothetical protein
MLILVEKAFLELPPEFDDDKTQAGEKVGEEAEEGVEVGASALTGGIGARLRLLFRLEALEVAITTTS